MAMRGKTQTVVSGMAAGGFAKDKVSNPHQMKGGSKAGKMGTSMSKANPGNTPTASPDGVAKKGKTRGKYL